jgi:hypothetical protein
LTNASPLSISMCDLTGRCINQIVEKAIEVPGNYHLIIDLQSLQTGIYLIVMKTQEKTIIRKVVKN